jgi:hypothetical protein
MRFKVIIARIHTSIVKVPKEKRKRKCETQITFLCDGSYFDN